MPRLQNPSKSHKQFGSRGLHSFLRAFRSSFLGLLLDVWIAGHQRGRAYTLPFHGQSEVESDLQQAETLMIQLMPKVTVEGE